MPLRPLRRVHWLQSRHQTRACVPPPPPNPPKVADRSFESGDAAAAQEYLVRMPDRVRKLAERANARRSKAKPAAVQFSWIFDRPMMV